MASGADLLISDSPIHVRAPAGPAFASAAVDVFPDNNILRQFDADVAATGVKYQAGKNSGGSVACYTPFIYAPGQGKPTFMNTMIVDEENRTPAEIKVSKRHEGAHAILWNEVAGAHASPYNMASPIVLCPRDWGRLMRNSERVAMTFNAMLGYADPDEALREAMKTEPGTVEDFERALAENDNDVEAALNSLARTVLNKNSNFYMLPTGKRTEKEALTLRNYYTWYSLLKYEDSNTFKWDYELSDMPAPIFVRLDDEDIWKMGKLLGLNALGSDGRADSFFIDQAPLMWKHQRWQSSMNYKMGIFNSDELPTVREALSTYFGITPEEYLEFSKKFKQGDAPLRQIKQVETKIIPLNAPLYA